MYYVLCIIIIIIIIITVLVRSFRGSVFGYGWILRPSVELTTPFRSVSGFPREREGQLTAQPT